MFVKKHVPFFSSVINAEKFYSLSVKKGVWKQWISVIFYMCHLSKFFPQFRKVSTIDSAFIDVETELKYLITH